MRLVEEGQDPSRIWAVTFTRNAAKELHNDLKGPEISGGDHIRVGTLHAYCFGLLMKHEALTGRTTRIVTDTLSRDPQFEYDMVVRDLIDENPEFNSGKGCSDRIKTIGKGWIERKPYMSDDPVDQLLEKHLNEWLGFHGAMLMDELVPEALRLLRSGQIPDALDAFDHVIVDEYQDLNKAEQEIIDLVSKNGSLAIVGDVNQSIYSFRKAHWQGMETFKEKYPSTHDVPLVLCRRNPKRVVKMANDLIANNCQTNAPPKLQPESEKPDGVIHAIRWNTVNEEVEGIAKYVKHLTDNHTCEPNEILIMVPRKKLGDRLLRALNMQSISVNFEQDALAKDVAQRALALLTLLSYGDDSVALRWWLDYDSPEYIGNQYQKLREYCEVHGKPSRSVLEGMVKGSIDLPSASSLVEPFVRLVGETDRLSKLDLRDLIDELLPEGNDDCAVLRDSAKRALVDNTDIRQMYQSVMEDINQPANLDNDSVRVMTMHKAKGLTSEVAIMAGCCNGMNPYIKEWVTEEQQIIDMREPRRLFYVAITRCTKILVFSCFATADKDEYCDLSMSSGKWDENRQRYNIAPSPFIDELGSAAPSMVEGTEWQAAQCK